MTNGRILRPQRGGRGDGDVLLELANRNSDFERFASIQTVAAEQGVGPVTNFGVLLGDFWPEDESADDFVAAVRSWRHGENPEGITGIGR